ncbi:MAG: hypothetical protein M3P51_03195 [Chloroflexota bacterium]|nr:hypothetical protein [Chloroflexota bacterium]
MSSLPLTPSREGRERGGCSPEPRSLLLIRLLGEFPERGCKDAVLETEGFRIPAIRTYLRFSFTPVYEVGGEDHRERWSAIFQQALRPIQGARL